MTNDICTIAELHFYWTPQDFSTLDQLAERALNISTKTAVFQTELVICTWCK